MATLTKQQQYRAVSAGIALGLLMNNCGQIQSHKIEIEFALAAAWRRWAHKLKLPSADTNISGARKDRDLIWIMTDLDSERKTAGLPFYWQPHAPGGPAIIIRDGTIYDLTNTEDLEYLAGMIDDRITAKAWAELAAAFLAKLR